MIQSRKKSIKEFVVNLLLCVLGLLLFCEYIIYYLVLFSCNYQELKTPPPNDPLHVMFLADTHLLGPIRGHPWDKLRREWQMHRAFQTAQTYFKPDLVIFLGDIFDEGHWVSAKDFDVYVKRFRSLFRVDESQTEIRVVAGNHDMGFHYAVTPKLNSRFEGTFGVKTVDRFAMKGVHFVTVNSMAMEGDQCFLCKQAEQDLSQVVKELSCLQKGNECDLDYDFMNSYSRPILLQHFPLHRHSDSECNEADEAPQDEKFKPFRINMDCLNENSTKLLLGAVQPRWVFSGHTHHGCKVYHGEHRIPEWSVSSFSWRNRNNPTFLLGKITPGEVALTKCFMPEENTVINIYILGAMCFILFYVWKLGGKHLRIHSRVD